MERIKDREAKPVQGRSKEAGAAEAGYEELGCWKGNSEWVHW